MNKKLKTALAYAKNIFETGALFQTSRKVELEICKKIPKHNDVVIVEFGIGHGNITKEILSNISENSKVYAFDVNNDFCEYVKTNLKDHRLKVINDGAHNINEHVIDKVDAIISSIPFSFFSKEKTTSILQNSYDILKEDAFISQILYSKHNFKKFKAVFQNCEIKKVQTIPLEYIYHCQKKRN